MPHALDIERILETAIGHHQAGSLSDAETLYRQVLDVEPDNVDALNLLGLILQDFGRLAESLDLIGRALEIDPDFAEALTNQARGLNFLNRPDDAHVASRRAVELSPDLGEAWQQLGLANLSLKKAEAAREAFRRAERLLPESVEVQAGLAGAAMLLLDHATVAETLPAVLAAQPDNVRALVDLSVALTALERPDEAMTLLRRALELDPNDRSAMVLLAVSMHKQRYEPIALEALCRRVLAAEPDNVEILIVLSDIQKWRGRFSEAKATLGRALTLRPDHPGVTWSLEALAVETGEVEDLAVLRKRLDDTALRAARRASAGFSIGKLLEREGDFDGAFGAYQQANAVTNADLRANNRAYDRDQFERFLAGTTEAFGGDIFIRFRPWGNPSELPVFIVGLPRSGTSLVQQIAASHPSIFGAGERNDIEGIMTRIARGTPPPDPVHWDPPKMRPETDRHIAKLRSLGGDSERVIDKMPDNALILGQIALLFPNARIIVCRRDLRDVCVSCFTTHFQMLPWTNDLADCAARALGVDRLMAHWLRVVPTRMLEIRYETLVANLEAESRRLIDFLGLEWDPACLDFHTNPRPVTTASYWQVRQRIHGDSIGRWRRFEAHLGPALKLLSGYTPDEPGGEAR